MQGQTSLFVRFLAQGFTLIRVLKLTTRLLTALCTLSLLAFSSLLKAVGFVEEGEDGFSPPLGNEASFLLTFSPFTSLAGSSATGGYVEIFPPSRDATSSEFGVGIHSTKCPFTLNKSSIVSGSAIFSERGTWQLGLTDSNYNDPLVELMSTIRLEMP